jgi:hypothetical protein
VAIALGATSMTDITLLAQHAPVLGAEPSDTTVRRTLELADLRTLDKVARVRAAVRTHVWSLIAATPAGFPWLSVAGKLLAGWLVIDLERHADHRALGEAGRCSHLPEGVRLPSIGGVAGGLFCVVPSDSGSREFRVLLPGIVRRVAFGAA